MSIRAINQLKIFTKLRSLIKVLVESVIDMVPFFNIFLAVMTGFALIL